MIITHSIDILFVCRLSLRDCELIWVKTSQTKPSVDLEQKKLFNIYKEAYNLKDCIVVLGNLYKFRSKKYKLRELPQPVPKYRPFPSVKLTIKRKENTFRVGEKKKIKTSQRTRCHVCSEKFATAVEMYAHLVKNHIEANKRTEDNDNTTLFDNTMFCPICMRQFNRQSALNAHVALHYTEDEPPPVEFKFRCHICREKFTDLSELRRHKREKHGVSGGNIPSDQALFNIAKTKKCYLCSSCDERFEELEEFARHNKEQHGLYTEVPSEDIMEIDSHNRKIQPKPPLIKIAPKLNTAPPKSVANAVTSVNTPRVYTPPVQTTTTVSSITNVNSMNSIPSVVVPQQQAQPKNTFLLATNDKGNWYILSPTNVGGTPQTVVATTDNTSLIMNNNPSMIMASTSVPMVANTHTITSNPAVILPSSVQENPVMITNNTASVMMGNSAAVVVPTPVQENPIIIANTKPNVIVKSCDDIPRQNSGSTIVARTLVCTSKSKSANVVKRIKPHASTSSTSSTQKAQSLLATVCTICNKEFTNKQQYQKHLLEHHHYYCSICSSKFSSITVLKKHVETHKSDIRAVNSSAETSTNTRVKCSYCPKIFINRKFLARHLQLTHQKTTCYVCFMEFPPEQLSKHFAVAHRKKKLDINKVNENSLLSTDIIDLDGNDMSDSDQQNETRNTDITKTTTVTTPIITVTSTPTITVTSTPTINVIPAASITVPAQEKPKIFLKNLKELMGSPEKQTQKPVEKKKPVACVDCGGTFRSADLLLEHMRQSRFKKCTQCSYYTCGVLPLNRHYDSQHRIWVYQCKCGITFNKRRDFEIHLVQIHENSKELDSEGKIKISFFTTPVECGLCGLLYSNFRLLKFHLQQQHPEHMTSDELINNAE